MVYDSRNLKALIVSLNPTLQKTLVFDRFETGGVNRTREYLFNVGGKGANCARILSQLGHECVYLTQAGGMMKDFFLSELEKDGIPLSWVESHSEIRFCYTIIVQDPFEATEITEHGAAAAAGTDEAVRNRFYELLEDCGTVVIAGSRAPGFSSDIYLRMMKEVRDRSRRLILDLTGTDLNNSLEYAPDLVKINLYEFITTFMPDAGLTEQKIGEEWYGPAEERGRELFSRHGTRFILTNGVMDTLVIDGEKTARITPEKAVPVNPIGSGDAVTGGVTAGLLEGKDLHGAAELGLECARRNAGLRKIGTIK